MEFATPDPVVVSAVGALTVACSILVVHIRQSMEQKRWQKHQTNVEAARVVMDLEARIHTAETKKVLEQIGKGWDKGERDQSTYSNIVRYINTLRLICIFHADGVLTESHMVQTYDHLIMGVDDNGWVHDFIYANALYQPIQTRLETVRKTHKRNPIPRRKGFLG